MEELLVGWMDGRKCPYGTKCWMSGGARGGAGHPIDLVAPTKFTEELVHKPAAQLEGT